MKKIDVCRMMLLAVALTSGCGCSEKASDDPRYAATLRATENGQFGSDPIDDQAANAVRDWLIRIANSPEIPTELIMVVCHHNKPGRGYLDVTWCGDKPTADGIVARSADGEEHILRFDQLDLDYNASLSKDQLFYSAQLPEKELPNLWAKLLDAEPPMEVQLLSGSTLVARPVSMVVIETGR